MSRPGELYKTLGTVLPETAAVLLFALRYSNAVSEPPPPGWGRISRYAYGRDYHRIMRERIEACALKLGQMEPCLRWRSFSDAVPLLERALAASGGKGFVGKNCMYIMRGFGSYVFLGELLINIDISETEQKRTAKNGCGSCSRCVRSCPTGALQEHMLDARRCISYLTIEKKGLLEAPEATAIGSWLFGCDCCQETCPYNAGKSYSVMEEFRSEHGPGPLLELAILLQMRSEEAFRQRFAGTALERAGRQGLVRNACCVAANTRSFNLAPALTETAADDASQAVRNQAKQALERLLEAADGLDSRRISAMLDSLRSAVRRET